LLTATYGPLPVLTDLLAGATGVTAAFIYGSWAARYQGEPGPVPNDIDVLVVGTADRDELDEIAIAAQDRLGRPVGFRRVGLESWLTPTLDDPFLTSVRQNPLVEIPIGEKEGSDA
jgi:predicted nucleotidyltransferase